MYKTNTFTRFFAIAQNDEQLIGGTVLTQKIHHFGFPCLEGCAYLFFILLVMIWFVAHYGECAVELFKKNEAHKLMRKSHF